MQIAYTEEYEQQRGKGSFPAMITPGYYLAKKAQENASDVSISLTATLCAYKHCKYHIFDTHMVVVGGLVCLQVVQLKREPASAG